MLNIDLLSRNIIQNYLLVNLPFLGGGENTSKKIAIYFCIIILSSGLF